MGAFYHLFVPKQAVGADLVYFDFFNPTGTAQEVLLHEVNPIVSGAVAVTGVVGVDLHLTRTTAVGTGGTAATREGTDKTACTIAALDSRFPLPLQYTARLTPSGGATAGALLNWLCVFTEETNGGAYNNEWNLARLNGIERVPPILIPENSGFRVLQGAVASVGNIGFNVTFETVGK
jgi:hypothetical protein